MWDEEHVSFVLADDKLTVWNFTSHILRHAGRSHVISGPVPHPDPDLYLFELESPRTRDETRIQCHALDAGTECLYLGRDAQIPDFWPVHDRLVRGWTELVAVKCLGRIIVAFAKKDSMARPCRMWPRQ